MDYVDTFNILEFYESICSDPNKKRYIPYDLDGVIASYKNTKLTLAQSIIIFVKLLLMDINEMKLFRKRKASPSKFDEDQQLTKKVNSKNKNDNLIQSSNIDLFINKSKLYPLLQHFTSTPIQVAVVWVYFPFDYVRRGYIISKILNNEFSNITVEHLLAYEKDAIKPNPEKLQFENEKQIVGIFMRIADILKDKSAARLAHFINENIYFGLCKYHSTVFKTMTPFSVLLDQHINLCVAKTDQRHTRQLLIHRFFENQEKTINSLIESLPQSNAENNKSNDCKEELHIEYYPNSIGKAYSQKIITCATSTGYIIQMKDSCVYDVLAFKDETFAHLPWSERLKRYETNETKVQLEKINLKTFKPIKFSERRQVTFSWMDNKLFRSRIVTTNEINIENLKNYTHSKGKVM